MAGCAYVFGQDDGLNRLRLLAEYGYPPGPADDATQFVLRQAELSVSES